METPSVAFVTWSTFQWIIGGMVGVSLAFVVLTYRANQILHSRVSERSRELDAYKLIVTKEFASVEHLQEVERRLVSEIKALTEAITALTRAVDRSGISRASIESERTG